MSDAAFEPALIKPRPPLEPNRGLCTLRGSCSGGSSECRNGHTEVHIPDLMVLDGRPATNVRSWGMFFKFFTTCANVYEVLPLRHTFYSLYLKRTHTIATLTMFTPRILVTLPTHTSTLTIARGSTS